MKLPREQSILEIDALLWEIIGRYLRPPVPEARDMSVTLGQMHCLRAIGRLGKPTMSEVADAMGLHPSTVTVLVDGLVAHGLVSRRADPSDRRVVRVAETAKGRKNHERHHEEKQARMLDLLSGLTDRDLARIHDSLTTLRDAARRRCEAAAGDPSRAPRRKASADGAQKPTTRKGPRRAPAPAAERGEA